MERLNKEQQRLLAEAEAAKQREQSETEGLPTSLGPEAISDDEADVEMKDGKVRRLEAPDRGVEILDAFVLKNNAIIMIAHGSAVDYTGDATVNSATPEGDAGEAIPGECISVPEEGRNRHGKGEAANAQLEGLRCAGTSG